MSKLKTIITTPEGVDLIRVKQSEEEFRLCTGCYFKGIYGCERPEPRKTTHQTKFYCEKIVFGEGTSFIYIEA